MTWRRSSQTLCKVAFAATALTMGLSLTDNPASAQNRARVAVEPPVAALKQRLPSRADQPRAFSMRTVAPNQAAERGIGAEVFYDLAIKYTDAKMFNPATGATDSVRLRSYSGDVTSPTTPFVAPTVEIWPGETFRLTLRNQLPANDASCPGTGDINVPHCFNRTNMHAHGLWISPVGNSDNVLISINPGVDFQYEYNIPRDHPAGTFWYHSHLHGATALQVSSGMAGALIIRGDRMPAKQDDGSILPGDVDTLLKTPAGEAFRERVLIFQQIAYACRDAAGAIKKNPDGTWLCERGDVGTVENYDQLTPGSWAASGRYTSINGEVIPTFEGAVAGTVERWRLILGGVRESLKLRFRKADPRTVELAARAATPQAKAALVDQNCTGAPLKALGLATDGLTRPSLNPRTDTVMQPGYREDLLVSFPEPGIYCVINGDLDQTQTVNNEGVGREVLGFVQVSAGQQPAAATPPETVIGNALIAAAQALMPEDVRAQVVADLQNGLKLTTFVKHPNIEAAEVKGQQTLGFRIVNTNVGGTPASNHFEIGELGLDAQNKLTLRNSAPYNPARIDRTLTLGSVDEWTLTSFRFGHPFHIHVNPFQIVEVKDAAGNDVSGPGDANTNQYANIKGTWKDTIFVQEGFTIKFRTRYERYIGDYVLHCHILDHEDQGMMQNVRVAIPDGQGGAAAAGHH
jgi:L-ascorbate oxidase